MTRVLLADDSALARRITRAALGKSSLENLDIVEVQDGQEACDTMDTSDFDLVIIDLYMPVMSGLSFLSTVREEGCDIPIIVITAEQSAKLISELREAGASAVVSKPLAVNELLRSLEEIAAGI